MNSPLLVGFLASFTLIAAIGAQNAFVLRQGIRREHVLPVVAMCTVSDMLLIAAGIAGFGALVKSTRTALLDATEHQELTFGTLLKKLPLPRDPSRLPLISVMFNIDQALSGEGHSLPGVALELISNICRVAQAHTFFIRSLRPCGGQPNNIWVTWATSVGSR